MLFYGQQKSNAMQWAPCFVAIGILNWMLVFPLYGPALNILFPGWETLLGNSFAIAHGAGLICLHLVYSTRIWSPHLIAFAGVSTSVLTAIIFLPQNQGYLQFIFILLGLFSAYLLMAWTPMFVSHNNPVFCLSFILVGSNTGKIVAGLAGAQQKSIITAIIVFLTILILLSAFLMAVKIKYYGVCGKNASSEAPLDDPGSGCIYYSPTGTGAATRKKYRQTVAALAAFGVAGYVACGITYLIVMPATTNIWPHSMSEGLLFYCLAVVLMAYYTQRRGLTPLAILSLSILGLGLAVCMLDESRPVMLIAYVLLLSGLAGAHLFYWLSLWDLSHLYGPRRTFSLGLGSCLLLITLTGIALNSSLPDKSDNLYYGFTGIIALLLALPYVFQLNHGSLQGNVAIPLEQPDCLPPGLLSDECSEPRHDTVYTEGYQPGLCSEEDEKPGEIPEHKNSGEATACRQPEEDLFSSPLTPTEEKVFVLLNTGMQDIQIAEKLFISKHTVKFHVRNILHKAKVRNRRELLVKTK